jgi:hypothetical protein
MRTKSLLLAAAALAAGVLSSQAQTVYSANIVGYVNQTVKAGEYQLIAPTLAATSTNAPQDVYTILARGDTILLWTGTSYASYSYSGTPGSWTDQNNNPVSAPNLGNGTGIFYLNNQGVDETNTTVGTVVLTNTVTFTAGQYALVGSTPPISDTLDGTNLDLPIQRGDTVLLWNSTNSTYQSYSFSGTVGSWSDQNNNPVASPVLPVGAAFFYLNNSGSPEVWTNNITIQ